MTHSDLMQKKINCEACGEVLDPAKAIWLELSQTSGKYYKTIPDGHISQGGFSFGTACAKKHMSVLKVCVDPGCEAVFHDCPKSETKCLDCGGSLIQINKKTYDKKYAETYFQYDFGTHELIHKKDESISMSSRLEELDLDTLDLYESKTFQKLIQDGSTKAEALMIIINAVDSDPSQLSSELSEIVEHYQ